MPNVIDYQTGERIDPVTGRPIRRVATGAVPTNFEDMLLPVNVGSDLSFAPGFGSNLIENISYYDEAVPAPATPQAPAAIGGQIPHLGGNSVDARNDDKTGAGAINDFGSWVDAIMHGMTAAGLGGPIKAVAGQVTGEMDYGDDFGNANQEDPEGWNDALAKATGSLPPGATSTQVLAKAAEIYADSHPGWGAEKEDLGGGMSVSGVTPGDPMSAAHADINEGPAKTPNPQPASLDDEGIGKPVDFTTASGVKPSKPSGSTGQGFGGAGSGSFGSGTTPGSGADPSKGGEGGGHGVGAQPGKPDTAGATAGGEKANPGNTHFNMGGYVQNMPASVSARRPKDPTQQPQQPTKPGPGAIKDPPRTPKTAGAFNGLPDSTRRRFTMGTEKGYATGGFVPKAGYQDGGAVSPEGAAGDMAARFNPTPDQIAPDGMIDNQRIDADEGEYVINRESAQALGPELLNALNDPTMALALSDLVEDVLALQSGGGMGGGAAPGPMGGAAPMPPAAPAPAPAAAGPPAPPMGGPGANPAQGAMPQQRTPGVKPSAYRKGGYVTAGRLSKVRA